MRTVLRIIDSISDRTGVGLSWFCGALVLLLCFEVVSRYVFNSPTKWSYESATHMGVLIAYGGWAYVLRHRAHVRIDIIYAHLSPKGKAVVDLICDLFLFFPLITAMTYAAVNKLLFSLSMNEILTETNWYPPAWPIRIIVLLGLCMFLLQGVAEFTRNLYFLMRNRAYE